MSRGKALVLGADGFIGRHIIIALRRSGWEVVACARRTDRLAQMGFAVLRADLADPVTHDPAFWRERLGGIDALVNAAGLLTGSEAAFQAVHVNAPRAVYAAFAGSCPALLISAVGIDHAETSFARFRRAGEAIALDHAQMVLRPGLVLGDTSYGGSSLLRALSAHPLVTPVIAEGAQPFNPIQAEDLASTIVTLLQDPRPSGIYPVGGPEEATQLGMIRAYRAWLGLRPVPAMPIPLPIARSIGWIGDALRLGPISRTSVDQLTAGVLAPSDPRLPLSARPFSEFHRQRPAGTQDLWHARLYLIRPLLRLTLAALWLVSGLIGLTLPAEDFLPLVNTRLLSDQSLTLLARLGGAADIAVALALLRGWRLQRLAGIQATMILAYSLAFTFLSPVLWLLPLGGLLKNIPLLVLIAIHFVLEEER